MDSPTDTDPPSPDLTALAELMAKMRATYEQSCSRPIGKDIFGPNCRTDHAFERFQSAVFRVFATSSTWRWYLDRIRALEAQLLLHADATVFDLDASNDVDFFDCIYQIEELPPLLDDIEECFSAFFTALQRRLEAVARTRDVIMTTARLEGLVPPTPELTPKLKGLDVWHIANFIKHAEGWSDQLKDREQETASAVHALGLLDKNRHRRSDWFATSAARHISQKAGLLDALEEIALLNGAWAMGSLIELHSDFAGLKSALATARRNTPNGQ